MLGRGGRNKNSTSGGESSRGSGEIRGNGSGDLSRKRGSSASGGLDSWGSRRGSSNSGSPRSTSRPGGRWAGGRGRGERGGRRHASGRRLCGRRRRWRRQRGGGGSQRTGETSGVATGGGVRREDISRRQRSLSASMRALRSRRRCSFSCIAATRRCCCRWSHSAVAWRLSSSRSSWAASASRWKRQGLARRRRLQQQLGVRGQEPCCLAGGRRVVALNAKVPQGADRARQALRRQKGRGAARHDWCLLEGQRSTAGRG